MDYNEDTPRKEITVSKTLLSVIQPYEEGHTLTEKEANVLNQVISENLRNNFAPKVKEARELAEAEGGDVDTDALQSQLDEYMSGYEFGAVRTGGGSSVDPVERIALNEARKAVRKALKDKGENPKDYEAAKINEMAQGVIAKYPAFMENAKALYEAQKSQADDLLEGIAA